MKRYFIIFLLLLTFYTLESKVFITPEEALKDAFAISTIEKKRVYLTEEDVKNLEKQLDFKITHRFYSFYISKISGKINGYAILHTDVVRTKEMSIMVILDTNYTIKKIYLISFYEPLEYKPTERWLSLYEGKGKNSTFVPGIDIPVVSGATLTSRSISKMVELTLKLTNYL